MQKMGSKYQKLEEQYKEIYMVIFRHDEHCNERSTLNKKLPIVASYRGYLNDDFNLVFMAFDCIYDPIDIFKRLVFKLSKVVIKSKIPCHECLTFFLLYP